MHKRQLIQLKFLIDSVMASDKARAPDGYLASGNSASAGWDRAMEVA
jgi:hypothetical protein